MTKMRVAFNYSQRILNRTKSFTRLMGMPQRGSFEADTDSEL